MSSPQGTRCFASREELECTEAAGKVDVKGVLRSRGKYRNNLAKISGTHATKLASVRSEEMLKVQRVLGDLMVASVPSF